MQNNNSNSAGSPFNALAPPSLNAADCVPNAMSSAAASELIATGMLWPYSQLFAPPYFGPQAPPPTPGYPIPIYCPSKAHVLDPQFQSGNLLRSTYSDRPSNNNSNNNMTIQIGLQCRNEGSSVANTNVENKTTVNNVANHRVALQPQHQAEAEELTIGQGDFSSKLQEFTKLAIHGCDLAERVTKNHKYRPCFKKIDSLCARLKQDISRPDGVLNNLNSQGMAWAVKDLIFVFTRIINAWLILKGYIYNQSEGMRKVQSAFSGNFQEGFFQWQEVTQQLIESIVESFENLDETVQKSRTNGTSVTGGGTGHGAGKPPNRMASADLSNFLWENKEVTMRASNKGALAAVAEEKFVQSCNNNWDHGKEAATSSSGGSGCSSSLSTPIYNEAERDGLETYYKTGLYQSMKRKESPKLRELAAEVGAEGGSKAAINEDFAAAPEAHKENAPPEMDLIDRIDLEMNMKKCEEKTEENIRYLLSCLQNIKETSFFFSKNFIKNYFPGFEKVIFKDIRTIMVDAEQGKYKYTFTLVSDLRMIVQSCRFYLQLNPDAHLIEIVNNFETQLESCLKTISVV